MAFNLQAYVNLFYRLMPQGPLWPTETATTETWDNYARALVSEFQRVDVKINEWLADYLPDTPTEQLEDWERILSIPASLAEFNIDVLGLSTAERQGLVRFHLALSGLTPADLEGLGTQYGISPTIYPNPRAVRYSGFLSGQRYGGASFAHSYLYEYMPNLSPDPNDLSVVGWNNTDMFVFHPSGQAPDGTNDASGCTPSASDAQIRTDLPALAVGDYVQVSVWIALPVSSLTPASVKLTLFQSGTSEPIINSETFEVTSATWRRIEARFQVTQPAASYSFALDTVTFSGSFLLWGFYAGVTNQLLEYQVHHTSPVHTKPLFRVEDDLQGWPFTYL